jgi:hypothetical protein
MSVSRFEISWRTIHFHQREPGTSDIPSFAKFIYIVRRFARWPCYADLSASTSIETRGSRFGFRDLDAAVLGFPVVKVPLADTLTSGCFHRVSILFHG